MSTNIGRTRFTEDQRFLAHFADEFLVVCPRCAGCATVTPLPGSDRSVFAARRLLCHACTYQKDIETNGYRELPGHDWYFGLPLWLRANCAGADLWAFNWRHLAWLERYVRAALRKECQRSEWGYRNQSAANRMPAWIKAAKNREDVLHCIEGLKRKLA